MKRLIVKIEPEGKFLELLDHSTWAICPTQTEIVQRWQPSQQVTVSESMQGRSFNRKIENVDTRQCVYALQVAAT